MRLGVGFAVLTLTLCGATAGVAHAGRGAFIPPMEIELGHAVTGAPDGGRTEATQLLVGISWASLYPKATPIDVSVGFISTITAVDVPMATARVTGPEEPSEVAAGGYIDVAVRGAAGRHWRTWIGGRGELMDRGRISALGAAARASIEIWAGTATSDRNAFLCGTVALSAWAESGVREQPHGGAATFVAAGMGMRLPLLIAGH
jgi:hypothetical protein